MNIFKRLVPFALLLLLLGAACTETTDTGETTCRACLNAGKTWQPEANACTKGCSLQDISCYDDICPEPCSASSCDTCFGPTSCEEAGCAWRQENEAGWCVVQE